MYQGLQRKFYCSLFFLALTMRVYSQETETFHPLFCYKMNSSFQTDILNVAVPRNKAIFFIETSCLSEHFHMITLDRRQLCALESVAKHNPNREIYVIFMANVALPSLMSSPSEVMVREILSEYPNIEFATANYYRFIQGTPVEQIGKLLVNKYAYDSYLHANDLLKLITLWRFGGIYIDFDIILLNSLNRVPRNFLGAESDSRIGSAIMGFSSEEFGHEYVTKLLEEYVKRFELDDRREGGSNFLSRIIKMICKQTTTSNMMELGCEAIKIYPPSSFYPIPWTNWTDLFDARQNERIWKLLEGSLMVHFWNKRSYMNKLRVNSYAPYVDLARHFCPKMFKYMPDYL